MTEEMTLLALKYKAEKKPFGYTYFRDWRNWVVHIYDADGERCNPEDHATIMAEVISEYQRRARVKGWED